MIKVKHTKRLVTNDKTARHKKRFTDKPFVTKKVYRQGVSHKKSLPTNSLTEDETFIQLE